MNNPVTLKKTNIRISLESSPEHIWSNFYSHEVPSSLILSAIHLEELNRLKKRVTNKNLKEEDDSKMLLQVRGQEVVVPPKELPEVTTHRSRILYNNNLKKIRAFLTNQPQMQTISNNEDVTKLREEFSQMKKFQETVAASQSNDPLYYERIVLKTPALFNRIVTAYNRHQNESARVSATKSTKRQSTSDKRRSVPSFLSTELDQDALRIIKYKELNFVVNLSNKVSVVPTEQTYKAYICKGNNGILVKNILKSRPWWSLVSAEDLSSCNFIWTQWKKTKGFDRLRTITKRSFGAFDQQQIQPSFNSKHPFLNKLIRLEHSDRLLTAVRYNPAGCFTFSRRFLQNNVKQLTSKYCLDSRHYENPNAEATVNHMEGGLHLHSKKLLYLNLKQYYKSINKDPRDVMPLTFIVKNSSDKEFNEFSQIFKQIQSNKSRKSHNIWICKPGQNSNRGNGITIHNDFESIKSLVKSRQGSKRSLIVQKYIDYPFLYNRRKFDIRCYLLLTHVNGILKGYWFDEGYIRTSSKQFTLKNIDNRIIHLTNDAVQKKDQSYGKFENSNKISFADFQKYLDSQHPMDKLSVARIFASMKEIATNIVKSVEEVINPKQREFCFELFGLDFMIDSKFKPYLIQANSNPCLQISGSILGRLIPQLIQNVIRIAIDPLFPPPQHILKRRLGSCATLETNKFQLIFDQLYEHSNQALTQRILTQNDMEQPQSEPQAEE